MSILQFGYDVTAPGTLTAVAGSVSGSLDASAAYGYKTTFVTAFGETEASATTAVTSSAAGSVALSAIPVSANGNVTARKLYRTVGGGSAWLLLDTISDNITTTYSDIIADGSLGAAAPTLNSAGSVNYCDGIFKLTNAPLSSLQNTITAYAGGGQTNAVQLSAEVSLVTVVASAGDSVKLPELSAALIGKRVTVKNVSATSMNLFPFLGQQIDALGANTALAVATTVAVNLVAESATNWRQI